MSKRKLITKVITNKHSLSALIMVMQDRILHLEKDIVQKREAVIINENRINEIRTTGKYIQTF